ncbi:MAG: DNA polymerase III subunit delta' [Anaerolineae bacterium]
MDEQYAPNWPLIGHEWAVSRIGKALNAGRLRHAYLISGPAQIGKTTFARAFAQAVNCLADYGRPCGMCRACTLTAQSTYADYSLIEADQGTLKIEQIRQFQHTLSLRPVEARYRVIVLRRFQDASAQAMDALLKTLEEPPPYVVLLLTADVTEGILPTIKSRCQPINLRPVPASTIREGLMAHFGVEDERAALLAHLSGGRMGWAIQTLHDDAALHQREEWLGHLEAILGFNRAGRFGLARKLSEDKDTLKPMLELWQSYWRDALLLAHSTTAASITNRDHRHILEQIASSVKVEALYKALLATRRTLKYLNANVNTRLALDAMLLEFPRTRVFSAPQ